MLLEDWVGVALAA